MATHTSLIGFSDVGNSTISETIRSNLIVFFDWGLLDKGAFFNVNIPTSGAYGGNWHILKPVNDPNYTNGQVWSSRRKNWVWENKDSTELSVSPIGISGIFVDNVFKPYGSGYHINYREGKIIFDSAQALSTEVKLEYSHKWISVKSSNEVPFFRKLETESFRVDDSNFLVSSGNVVELSQTRLQMPLVEVLNSRKYEPYEIGNNCKETYTDVVFHILAEDDVTAGKLVDIIAGQDERVIALFDINRMARNNAFPLDYRGEIASGVLTYPTLVKPSGEGGYRTTEVLGGRMVFSNARASLGRWVDRNIYNTTVKMTTKVIL